MRLYEGDRREKVNFLTNTNVSRVGLLGPITGIDGGG